MLRKQDKIPREMSVRYREQDKVLLKLDPTHFTRLRRDENFTKNMDCPNPRNFTVLEVSCCDNFRNFAFLREIRADSGGERIRKRQSVRTGLFSNTPRFESLFNIPLKKHDRADARRAFFSGIGIRTPTNRVRVCRATVTQFRFANGIISNKVGVVNTKKQVFSFPSCFCLLAPPRRGEY